MSKTAKKKVNLLLIGLSKRGKALLDLLLEMDDVNVAAVCDVYEDRLQNAVQAVEKVYGRPPQPITALCWMFRDWMRSLRRRAGRAMSRCVLMR